MKSPFPLKQSETVDSPTSAFLELFDIAVLLKPFSADAFKADCNGVSHLISLDVDLQD